MKLNPVSRSKDELKLRGKLSKHWGVAHIASKWSAASERKKYALVIYGDSGSLCEANLNASFVQKIFHITE